MTVRVAVVGLGWAGRSIWLPRLAAHPAYQVVAGVDPAAAAEVLDGDVPVLCDIDALSPADVDLAVVAVPNHLHADVACRLLARGIPVFLEKPVCLNSDEAERLAAAERVGGTVLLAGSAARHRADVRALEELTGTLGQLRHVSISWVRARGVPDAGGWFTRRDLAGGGALVDLGWHLLDTLPHLVGPIRYTHAVGAVSSDFVNDDASRAAWREDQPVQPGLGDVEDTARGFLVSDNGLTVFLRASWASHEALDTTVISVEGSAGVATLRCTFGFSPNRPDGPVLTVVRGGRSEVVALPDEEIGAEYRRQLDALPGLLADPASRGRAVAEARDTIAVIERLYDSAPRPVPAGV
ncbi:Gfo/Idh/MocA family oxidoreductase [Kutzneria sp. NPDC051319]|uniref:Gfo/Idh/MocA family protein n=1 Tax=Kutzneria sp. NPDC051319 TaxID=3155047 RepID=UPI003436C0B3